MKVFLSSTYIDLIEYRKAAKEALERLGQQVGGMEIFGASDEESIKASLKSIEECDLFVGIYAHRYGYIPEGKDVSITEQEFDYAQKLGKPFLGFIVSEDHPWSPRFLEGEEKRQQLHNKFLNTKIKQLVIDFFTTPDDLALKLVVTVHHFVTRETVPVNPFSRLKVFLCYAKEDQEKVTNLYNLLSFLNVDVWLDKANLFPGQDWEHEIKKAVRDSDIFIACISKQSIRKKGYVQKELKFAIEEASLQPEGAIYIIPARLEECIVPEFLLKWQWVDLFIDSGFEDLRRSLKEKIKQLEKQP